MGLGNLFLRIDLKKCFCILKAGVDNNRNTLNVAGKTQEML